MILHTIFLGNVYFAYAITAALVMLQNFFALPSLDSLSFPFSRGPDGTFTGPAGLCYPVRASPVPWFLWWCLTTLVFPCVPLLLSQLFVRSLWDLDAAASGVGIAQMIFTAFATIFRLMHNIPGPTLLTICKPVQALMNQHWSTIPEATRTGIVWFDLRICEGHDEDVLLKHMFTKARAKMLQTAAASFPDSTIGSVFVAGAFLTLYLNAHLKPFNVAGRAPFPFTVLLVIMPLLGACAISSMPLRLNEHWLTSTAMLANNGARIGTNGFPMRLCRIHGVLRIGLRREDEPYAKDIHNPSMARAANAARTSRALSTRLVSASQGR
ncbi:MAG: hypothetical protein Q9172_006854 [Xanthocarpia lactea]